MYEKKLRSFKQLVAKHKRENLWSLFPPCFLVFMQLHVEEKIANYAK